MQIKWAALAQTAGVSLGITLAVVLVFALGIFALNRRDSVVESGGSAAKAFPALAAATLCFAACAGVVLYGISLIANK
ncbi:hypothetical protein [Kitasatospora terrestris]|uniref:Uncharacterized protein n=1 Tax=Kitasatospora terrestris TaxID=258051 RepID=A0ABP9E4T7_9ACTN